MRSRRWAAALALALAWLPSAAPCDAAPPDVDWTRAKTRVGPSVATIEMFVNDARCDQGTAFAVAPGVFATCRHLFRRADRAEVVRADGTRVPVEGVLLCAAVDDVALVKAVTDLPAVAFGDEARLAVGQPLAAIGSTNGVAGTFEEGAYSRRRDFRHVRGSVEATVRMASGASGCPLFDRDGLVVGMGIARTGPGPSDGLFVPISRVRALLSARSEKTPLRPLGTAATFRSASEWNVQSSREMESARQAAASGDMSKVVTAMRAVVAKYPESAVALYGLAGALSRVQKDEEAVPSLRAAVSLDPIDLDSWEDLGDALERLGRHQESAEAFGHVLDIESRMLSVWVRRGIARMGAGDLAGALKDIEVATDAAPDYAAAWGWLAIAYAQADRDDDADRALGQLSRLEPDHVKGTEDRVKAIRAARAKPPK